MHIYVCPYCVPSDKARLFLKKEKRADCACKKGLFRKDKECKKIDYKCKEVLECSKCDAQFRISLEFLQEQKRKMKEG